MLSLSTFDAPGVSTGDTVFIPLAALPGIEVGELASAIPLEQRTSKVTLAVLEQCYEYLSDADNPRLGFSVTKGNPSGSGNNRFTQSYTVSSQVLADVANSTITNLPVGSTNLGKFSLADIFPGAESLGDGDAVSEGVTFALDRLGDFRVLGSDDTFIDGGSDNRALLDALLSHLATDRELRSASTASAVTATSISNFTASTIPATFNAQNSGIDLDNTASLTILQRSYSLTLELDLDQASQTFDVRVATA